MKETKQPMLVSICHSSLHATKAQNCLFFLLSSVLFNSIQFYSIILFYSTTCPVFDTPQMTLQQSLFTFGHELCWQSRLLSVLLILHFYFFFCLSFFIFTFTVPCFLKPDDFSFCLNLFAVIMSHHIVAAS